MLRLLATHTSYRRRAATVLLAAAGGGAALAYSLDHPSTRATVSFSPLLRPFLSPALDLLSPVLSVSPVSPSTTTSKVHFSSPPPSPAEASGKDDSTCCHGCLGRNSIANAAAAASPAVVNISVTQGISGLMFGKSIGSGTIIDPDGTILTCAHVGVDLQSSRKVLKGKVDVTLQDGRQFEGTVVNADLHSDIAVVKIESKTPFPSAKLGASGKIRPGDWVLALGCPLSLQNTVTSGIVSCVDRKSSDLGLGGMRREYLQTDCAINQGTLRALASFSEISSTLVPGGLFGPHEHSAWYSSSQSFCWGTIDSSEA